MAKNDSLTNIVNLILFTFNCVAFWRVLASISHQSSEYFAPTMITLMLLNLVHGGLILAWILDQVSIVIRFAWSHAQDGAIYVLAIDTLTWLQSKLAPLSSD